MVESLLDQPLHGVAPPEQILLPPTQFCPNSPMPVLIYRDFFKDPRDPHKIRDHVESCGWVKMGPVWKATKARHYHPNVHECYDG
ncbi:hypothetical protein LTS13_003180 [Exophiala xenobiotica]|nr:hypothetical protein LTS13_003180 [Exophiala xenobiotica]KAK5391542.1 hypothetical protein LTR79_011091 [Exophiala xenobiotica]KAK5432405.1 hypothetical protein LTR18_011067 [Exophiala xenobiotica]KAK5477544.1 hypothetical protein LTR83_011049 [Exophiala xenobiotica]KAK5507888.1 hypothetical protein LTR07_011051 [Exophiala xenobiotica]